MEISTSKNSVLAVTDELQSPTPSASRNGDRRPRRLPSAPSIQQRPTNVQLQQPRGDVSCWSELCVTVTRPNGRDLASEPAISPARGADRPRRPRHAFPQRCDNGGLRDPQPVSLPAQRHYPQQGRGGVLPSLTVLARRWNSLLWREAGSRTVTGPARPRVGSDDDARAFMPTRRRSCPALATLNRLQRSRRSRWRELRAAGLRRETVADVTPR